MGCNLFGFGCGDRGFRPDYYDRYDRRRQYGPRRDFYRDSYRDSDWDPDYRPNRHYKPGCPGCRRIY